METKKIIVVILILFFSREHGRAQIDANEVFSLVNLTTAEMNSIILPHKGTMLFNTDNDQVYQYTGASWTIVDDTSGSMGTMLGSVLFSDTSGNVTENNSQFFWNNTNNRLGIGTDTPTETLDINGTVRARNLPTTTSSGLDILAITADGEIQKKILYEKIVIWAEEGADLATNTREWSYGDRGVGRIGIPLPEDWEAYAISFHADVADAGVTVEVSVYDYSVTEASLFTFTASGATNNISYTQILATPIAIPAGTALGFRSGAISGVVRDARAAVWLRRRP